MRGKVGGCAIWGGKWMDCVGKVREEERCVAWISLALIRECVTGGEVKTFTVCVVSELEFTYLLTCLDNLGM